VLLHSHLIKVVQLELADALNQNREFAAEEEILRLEINFVIVARG